jgi:hypothetical protein
MPDGQISWAEAARTMAPCAEVTQSIGMAHKDSQNLRPVYRRPVAKC